MKDVPQITGVNFNPQTMQFEPEQPECGECGYRHPLAMWCDNASKVRATAHKMMKLIRKQIRNGNVLR